MAEYLSKDEILTYLKPLTNTPAINIKIHIQGMKAADVQPAKRGKWKWDDKPIFGNPYGSYICSECGAQADYKDNYCCECGADMRGDTE